MILMPPGQQSLPFQSIPICLDSICTRVYTCVDICCMPHYHRRVRRSKSARYPGRPVRKKGILRIKSYIYVRQAPKGYPSNYNMEKGHKAMDKDAGARIQSAEPRKGGVGVEKESFPARAQVRHLRDPRLELVLYCGCKMPNMQDEHRILSCSKRVRKP